MAYTDGPGDYRPPAQLRFEIIGEAWQKFQANMTPWILAVLIQGVILGAILGVFYVGVFAASFSAAMAQQGKNEPPGMNIGLQLGSNAFSIGMQALQFPFLGGLVLMAIKQLRGQSIQPGDVFSGFAQFGPLAVAGLLYGLGVTFGSMLCLVPGLLLAGLWMLTVPLIVDQNMSAVDALKASLARLQPQMWSALGLYFVLALVAGLGSLACGIGGLFTAPLLPIGIALIYKDFYPERFASNSASEPDF
jgi:uncharacterized membrane protein